MERAEYEPEQFPALMYRDTEYSVLVISSDKIPCTGLTDRQTSSEAIDNMASRVQAVV